MGQFGRRGDEPKASRIEENERGEDSPADEQPHGRHAGGMAERLLRIHCPSVIFDPGRVQPERPDTH
jgi:hypothetical protein